MASSALKALLAVLAVAGFQNRDKIGELLCAVSRTLRVMGRQVGSRAALAGCSEVWAAELAVWEALGVFWAALQPEVY